MNCMKNQKGFTVLEFLIASFLSAMVMGSFFAAVKTYGANDNSIYVKMSMEEQGMNAIRKMEHELRQSSPSNISVLNSGASIRFEVPSESSPTVASTYAVNWTGAHTITYAISNGQLIRTDADATTDTTARVLCNFASSVTFAVPSSGIVTIALNLSQSLQNTRVLTHALTARVQTKNP